MSTTVPPSGTYYQLLGVAPTASAEEIRSAYRRLARALHPDTHGGTDDPAMASVNEAWHVLSDPARRASYDATLRRPVPPRVVPTDVWDGDDDSDDGLRELVDDGWDEMDPDEARAARRLAVVLAVTVVVVLIMLAALFLYAFTRSGTLHPSPHSGRSLPILVL